LRRALANIKKIKTYIYTNNINNTFIIYKYKNEMSSESIKNKLWAEIFHPLFKN